ncbi:MAG: iron-containing alcohol dehydrogenase, partial [Oscillospiraceae bacterium]|nr:iron-containing alcohol dehydrogenase [Oscillospiraceae bacterium]
MESIYCAPNPILFGIGSSKETGKKLKEFGCKKVILVYDMGIKKVGVVDKIDEIIKAEGIETVYYDN